MNKKLLLTFILLLAIIGFSTGFYLKFIRSYSDNKLQVEQTKITGEKSQRQPRLGEMIKLMSELEDEVKDSQNNFKKAVVSKSDAIETNKETLKRLKTINYTSIIVMVVSIVIAGLISTNLVLKKN